METGVATLRMIVAPDTGFGTIAQIMARAGLVAGSDDAITPPAIPGEREFAYWTAPGAGSRIHYTFNPVVFLRALTISGVSAGYWHAALSSVLPVLDLQGIAALLQAESQRELLLGLYAAGELQSVSLIADVERLRIHTDRRVSQTAAQVAEKLAAALLSIGAERLAAQQRRHPDHSAVFAHLGDAGTRRETLIWLLRDELGASPETVKVLRAGLHDPDWRVRVTAMFVAARLKLPALWQEVRQLELPTTSRSGLDTNGRWLLKASRRAILSELAGDPLPQEDSPGGRLMREMRDAVAARSVTMGSEIRNWVDGWLSVSCDD